MDTGHSQAIFDYTLRGNYPNYYNIKFFVKNRNNKNRETSGIGYIPAEVEYRETESSVPEKFNAEFADIPYLCQKDKIRGKNYLSYLIASRKGDESAKAKVDYYREQYLADKEWYYKDVNLIENKYVVHSGTSKDYDIYRISHKGSNLLDLIKEGYPVPDFSILTTDWFSLNDDEKEKNLRIAISNLEQMTSEKLNNTDSPLVFAIRCAMPQYIPGLMPTYLNAGVVPDTVEALKKLYGNNVAGKIYLNNLFTLYSLLYHDKNIPILKEKQYYSSTGDIYKKIQTYFDLIYQVDKELLFDPYYQISFLLKKACEFFEKNKELPYTLIKKKTYPSFILQKMVWTIRDENSYPGILYSRHSRTGLGSQIESCKNIFGEDIMSGNVEAVDTEYFNRKEIKESYPAVYHFSPVLRELEISKKSPVTIEFAAESYENTHLFAVLQLNKSELTGRACLLSTIDLYKKGILSKDNVINLVQPYHLRQIFSETIDAKALSELIFFSEGISVLPRSAGSVKIYFSADTVLDAKKRGEKVCYCKEHFVPSDTVIMKEVDAIISLNPAAIHVVTACRGYGIPAFLNLENYGIKLENNTLINSQNIKIKEGDWITISSKKKTVFIGKATFTPARFRKYIDGMQFDMEPKEEIVFKNMAKAYKEYDAIVSSLDHSDISNLDDLTKFIRTDLEKDQKKAENFVNNWYDTNSDYYVKQILKSELGTHQDQHKLYKLLTTDRQISFYKKVTDKCLKNDLKGFKAGSFMLGRFICIKKSTKFWKSFNPKEIVFLLNEYILFEKYMYVLYDVGERNISRAKSKILEHGLEGIIINKGKAGIFITLKLTCENWNKIEESLSKVHEPETKELIEMLQKPYGFFYDYTAPWSVDPFKKICKEEGIELPGEDDN
ncbi:MAG: hypothetical protein K8R54_16115 [Bacteroidales bacterium]|nr:hypothetical protein [Bacteroidales bacterium]